QVFFQAAGFRTSQELKLTLISLPSFAITPSTPFSTLVLFEVPLTVAHESSNLPPRVPLRVKIAGVDSVVLVFVFALVIEVSVTTFCAIEAWLNSPLPLAVSQWASANSWGVPLTHVNAVVPFTA